MVDITLIGWTGYEDRSARLHAGENAGTSRGEALIQRITDRVDLVEQAEHLVVGGDIAADDDVVDHAQLGGARIEFLFDLVDAADKRSDIDNQRLLAAFFQDRADVKQGIGLLARIDRSEMADHQPSLSLRGGEPLPQFALGYPPRTFHLRPPTPHHA